MRILFLTDLHGARGYLPGLIDAERGADLVIVGGDITSFGGEEDARAMIEPLLDAFPLVRSVHGNVDLDGVLGWLQRKGLALHGKGEALAGVGLFGCGGSNPTPMRTPTEYPENEIAAALSRGFDDVAHAECKVMISHTPPVDTALDRMFAGKHVGSTAVRAFLERHDVDLCLCGHIHEADGLEHVGGTLVVNPGAFCSGRYAVVERGDGKWSAVLRRVELGRVRHLGATVAGLSAKLVGYARHRIRR